MNIKGLVFGLVSMVALATAHADTAPSFAGEVVAQVTVRGRPVNVYQVAEVKAPGTPDGTKAFAITMAYWLHDWTAKNGVEAIANLCHTADGKTWGARVLTIYAHTTSPITQACPTGMVLSGVNIHSHPQLPAYRANAVDKLFLRQELRRNPIIGTEPDSFSDADFHNGAGYMVGAQSLNWNDGHWHASVVWDMSKPDPTAPAEVALN